MEKKRFLFYLDWRTQMSMMTDQQVRRFIINLCNFTEGKEIDLPTDIEKALWIGVVPSLKINQEKYDKKVENNRSNGQKGGRPKSIDNPDGFPGNQINPDGFPDNPDNPDGFPDNPDNPDGFPHNPKNPIRDNSKEINENRQELTENWKEKNGNSELENGNRKLEIDNWQELNEKSRMSNENWLMLMELRRKENSDGFPYDYINETYDKIVPVLTIEEYRILMDKIYPDYPNWEEELVTCGSACLIKITKEYHKFDANNIYTIMCCYKLLTPQYPDVN